MAMNSANFDLSGHWALVTGASRGLGAGCAEALAQHGANLVLLARGAAELEQVADRVRALGRKVELIVGDVTDVAAIGRSIATGPAVSILVNNAGTNIPEPFTEVTPDHFDSIMQINLRAAFFVAQSVASRMIDAGSGGSIIHMSSQMGHVGATNRTVYCASKHAIEGLTKAMAVELAPQRIRVNSVAPTFVETPMTRGFFEDEAFRQSVIQQIPLGELAQIDDIASAVLYLASPASKMVTGSCLKVDGGWTAR